MQCEMGLPPDPEEIEGVLITRGEPLDGIERAPDFMEFNVGQK